MKIISIPFFLVAGYGFMQMAYGNPPVMQPSGNHTESFKMGYYFGTYLSYYILPFVLAFVGWLFYKYGNKKIKSTRVEEKESQETSK